MPVELFDISQPVDARTAVWPGDAPYRLDWTMRRDEGASVNVAAVCMSVHTGTHVDGPYHVDSDGERAGELPLDAFIGPATVVDALDREWLDVDAVDGVALDTVERVLFRTREDAEPGVFPESFAAVTPALARRLAEAGVKLVGTDAPSVDPADSRELEAHGILMGAGIAVLENLVLADVSPGEYTLVAPPLKLTEADSAPARAVLVRSE